MFRVGECPGLGSCPDGNLHKHRPCFFPQNCNYATCTFGHVAGWKFATAEAIAEAEAEAARLRLVAADAAAVAAAAAAATGAAAAAAAAGTAAALHAALQPQAVAGHAPNFVTQAPVEAAALPVAAGGGLALNNGQINPNRPGRVLD